MLTAVPEYHPNPIINTVSRGRACAAIITDIGLAPDADYRSGLMPSSWGMVLASEIGQVQATCR